MSPRALSHTRSVLVNRLATPLGAFAVLVLIGRHSDDLLGEYALVMTFYYVMQMLPLLGLTPYLAREVARRPDLAGKYFSSLGLLSIVGCVVVDVLVAIFLQVADYAPQVQNAISVTGILIFPGILLFIAEVIFMSLGRAGPAAQIALVENLSRVVLSVAALWLGGELIELIWIFFVTRFFALTAFVAAMKSTGIIQRFEPPDPQLLRETARVLPAFLSGAVMFVVFSRMDFLVLSIHESVAVIGHYAIGYRLFEISIIVLTALIMALFPWISRKFVGARTHFRVAIRSLLLLFACGLGLASLAGILIADTYVFLLFRNQYPHPVLLTQLFMCALLVAGMDYVGSSMLHAIDRQGIDTHAMLIGGAVNVALLFWLIPPYGIYGAFFAKLAATSVQSYLKFRVLNRMIEVEFGAGEAARFGLVVFFLGAGAMALADAGLSLRLGAIAAVAVLVPICMLVAGILSPLRLLRFYWRPRHACDVTSIGDLVDVVVSDSRRRDRVLKAGATHVKTDTGRIDRAAIGVMLMRIGRFFHLRGNARTESLVLGLGRRLCGVFACAKGRIGPGWVVLGAGRVAIYANAGQDLLCSGGASVGDAGAGMPQATLGDGVTLLPDAVVPAGVVVPDGTVWCAPNPTTRPA